MSQICYLMGRRPMKDVLGNHLKRPIIPFGSLVEYHPITSKDQSRIHQYGKKVLPALFLGYALYAGGSRKGDVLIADLEELETMDASEIYSQRRLNAKEVIIFPKENGKIIFPWEHLPWYGNTQFEEKVKGIFSENQKGLHLHHLKTHFRMRWSDKWYLVHVRKLHIPPSRWTQSQTLLVEKRIIHRSTERHWRLQNYKNEFGCYARKAHRWLLEYRWIKRLVWFLDRFHSIYFIGRKSSRRIYVVQVEINEKTAYIQARSFMARTLENNGKACQAEGKAEVVQWKAPSGERTRIERYLFSLTLRTRNSKKPSRTRVRSWKHQWLLLCPAKLWRIMGVVDPTRLRQNLRVFWKLMNPQECVWEIRYRIIMKTILQEKVKIHYSTTIWFTNLFQCLKHEDSRRKSSSGQGMGKLEKISAWNLTKVRSKKEVIDEARTSGATVHFASLMDICHLKNAELEAKHQKYKSRIVLRGDIVKDDSGSFAVFTEQGSSASQMTAAKIMVIISRLPGCDGQAADAVSAYTQVKMEDAHKSLKVFKIGVSRHLDSSTTTRMA